jgi:nitrite reductase/ring-hydroxylating ferredoxin subunit/DMSO/TMAO reductase YedYZ heme-binding membrane subunit
MSVNYAPVLWNRQKRLYDRILLGAMALYLLVFSALQLSFYPEITAETLIIRATGTLAFLMLHVILCIGPLARIEPKLLPLLYNRRHFGVTMCCVALTHGIFNLVQFHALGNVDPLVSLFVSNENYASFGGFPFEVFGFFALLILLVMAATSHDFWLKNLTPRVWKTLHMLVYVAYALLTAHVMLGVIQLEKSPVLIALTAAGACTVTGLHVWAGIFSKKQTLERDAAAAEADGFQSVCRVEDIAENRAKTLLINGENIAVFKYDGKLSAVSNLCRHQNGPLGEGKIVDGCITCPWHGYQYLPHNGQSPPPFTERVETYDVKLIGDLVYVNPKPYPPGTERPPCPVHRTLEKFNKITEAHEAGN